MEFFKLFGTIVIESEEAIAKLEETKNEAAEVEQSFGKADQKTKNLSDGFTVLKGVASNLITEGFSRLCSAVGDFIADGYEYSKQIEGYATSFEVMTGSEEKAIEVTQRLQEIGAATPFELPHLANTTQLLMNYGFTADEAVDKMTMLGDISQGSSEKMSRIATAYGQMSSAGKVSLEDVKQMIEAGFNPLQEISESTGESMESLYDRISKGTISVDEITASMVRSTSEGGKYFGSMDKQSKTLDGRLSTLKDTANEAISNIIAPLLQQLADEWLPKVTDAVATVDEKFTAFGNWISEHQGLFIALGAVIGVITTALTAQAVVQAVQIAMNAAEVTSLGALIAAKTAAAAASLAALAPYLLITAAIAAVIAVIVLCVKHWDEIKAKTIEVATAMAEKWNDIKEAIAEKVASMLATVTSKFQEIKTTIETKVKDAKEKVQEAFENIKTAIQDAMDQAKQKVSQIWEDIKGFFADAVNVGQKIVDDIKQGIANAWEGLKTWFKDLWDGLFGNLKTTVTVNKNEEGSEHSNATGLNFVPYDGYNTTLHHGEAVLNAVQAKAWRRGEVPSNVSQDVTGVLLMILDAVQAGNSQETVLTLNNREFGRAVRSVVNA